MTLFVLAVAGQLSVAVPPGKTWQSEPFPVKGGERYEVTFDARVEGTCAIERNAQAIVAMYDINFRPRGFSQPEWLYEFRTVEGKLTHLPIVNAGWRRVYSADVRKYHDAFYAPLDAVSVVVRLWNRTKVTFEASPPVLKPYQSPYVNINGDFDLGGEHCYAGFGNWLYHIKRRLKPREDGKGYRLCVSSTCCDLDPMIVKPGHNYEFDVKLAPNAPNQDLNFRIVFSDRERKPIPHSGGMTQRVANGPARPNFIAPENAVYMDVHIQFKDYDYIHIVDKGVPK